MVSKIIEKLSEIEAALRMVREELAHEILESDCKYLSNVDLTSLEDVTPVEWKQWFDKITFPVPTEIPRFKEILPCFMVGFPPADTIIARIEQRPYISNSSKLKQAVHIELINPVEWLTIELIIPPRIATTHHDLYLVWTANLNVPQVVHVDLHQGPEKSPAIITKISREILPSMDWTEIKPLHLAQTDDIKRTKIVFFLPMDKFKSIRFNDIRLYKAGAAPGVDHS
jgi:hypothetical protein